MKSKIWLTCLLLGICTYSAYTQVVFSEPFDEVAGSVSGVDNVAGVAWNTSCPTCLAGDYFNVQSNVLECEDTNGPAVWTTGNIDISPCTGNAQISMAISALGTMEECVAGCGCNCVDWVMVEYSINGGAFMSASSSAGGPCAQGCTGGNYALIGDAVAFPYNYIYCIPATGSTLVLRVTMQTWAAGEKYRIDDVTVQCFNCVLPVEIIDFKATLQQKTVELSWNTVSESSTSHFTPERAMPQGDFLPMDSVLANGNSHQLQSYRFVDENPTPGIAYYRIKQVDLNGTYSYSQIAAVYFSEQTALAVHQWLGLLTLSGCVPNENIQILDMMGRLVFSTVATQESFSISHTWVQGIYRVVAGSGEKCRQTAFLVH